MQHLPPTKEHRDSENPQKWICHISHELSPDPTLFVPGRFVRKQRDFTARWNSEWVNPSLYEKYQNNVNVLSRFFFLFSLFWYENEIPRFFKLHRVLLRDAVPFVDKEFLWRACKNLISHYRSSLRNIFVRFFAVQQQRELLE